MKYIIGVSVIILVIISVIVLRPGKSESAEKYHKVVVTEVLQAGSYTYLLAKENKKENWLAVPSMIASEGDTYYYTGGLLMENFESKDFDRIFESVIFLEALYETPPSEVAKADPSATQHTGAVKDPKMNFKVDHLEDGITIAELFSDKKKYEGKTVKIRGAVTKFNPDIMNTNWLHIQDGTDFEGKYDLTLTTNQVVETGSILTVEGKIILDKDFGYGYVYEILMEDASILEESAH